MNGGILSRKLHNHFAFRCPENMSKQANGSFGNGFLGPKSFRDVRETGSSSLQMIRDEVPHGPRIQRKRPFKIFLKDKLSCNYIGTKKRRNDSVWNIYVVIPAWRIV